MAEDIAVRRTERTRVHEIDFHEVRFDHMAVHIRLENWARCCRGTSSPEVAPMFQLYVSTARAREEAGGSVALDKVDGAFIQRIFVGLPIDQRFALKWCYIRPVSVRRECRERKIEPDSLWRDLNGARDAVVEATR